MKKYVVLLIIVIAMITLSGCLKVNYPELPENPVVFEMGEYIDKSDDEAGYSTIEYNGRIYMPYGTIKRAINSDDIDKCIGYVVQDGQKDTDERIYTLFEDKANNYLMMYYVGESLMNQPDFWRAVDTNGKNIDTPVYIESFNYNYWKID